VELRGGFFQEAGGCGVAPAAAGAEAVQLPAEAKQLDGAGSPLDATSLTRQSSHQRSSQLFPTPLPPQSPPPQ
jgi:hypothetical protein